MPYKLFLAFQKWSHNNIVEKFCVNRGGRRRNSWIRVPSSHQVVQQGLVLSWCSLLNSRTLEKDRGISYCCPMKGNPKQIWIRVSRGLNSGFCWSGLRITGAWIPMSKISWIPEFARTTWIPDSNSIGFEFQKQDLDSKPYFFMGSGIRIPLSLHRANIAEHMHFLYFTVGFLEYSQA